MTFEPLAGIVVRCDTCRRRPPQLVSPALATVSREGERGWVVRAVLPKQDASGALSYPPLDVADWVRGSAVALVSDEAGSIALNCRLCATRPRIRFHRLIEGAIAAVAECRKTIYV